MSEQEVVITATPLEDTSAEAAGPEASADLSSIMDLKQGMELTGTVKSVTDFGAFVDLGIAQDGLVHISEMGRRRVDKVSDVVKVGDEVKVWVKKVDKKRGRISLTMVRP